MSRVVIYKDASIISIVTWILGLLARLGRLGTSWTLGSHLSLNRLGFLHLGNQRSKPGLEWNGNDKKKEMTTQKRWWHLW